MNKTHKSNTIIVVFAILLLLINLLVFSLADTSAQGDPLPTPTPLGTPPPPTLGEGFEQPVGGTIILHVPNAPDGVWTAVQWQDAFGDWHTVEGWQSHLRDEFIGWWVAPEDFNSGPFRWVLYDEEGGSMINTSESFMLPKYIDHILTITLPQLDP